MATNYHDSFIKKLQEIFMMDHAELDFGIYRIMNQKRSEIEHFLKFELLPQVKTALAGAPDGSDNEVFSHLVTFFSRYYDNGDFISKRRYKDNTYAIPYNGEEVKLHWANADQYYIKSSEYFRDYTFVLPTSRRKVHFVLKDASTEQNNNKAANNMERRFALYKPENEEERFYEVNGEELNIFFTYELMPKATKQNDLLAEALGKISEIVPEPFSELLTVKSPTDKNVNRTLLEKHLTDYTAKNSFDYFIHKDLGGFLRRELDFYIKNEVMLLDDLDAQHIASQLNIIKAIKTAKDQNYAAEVRKFEIEQRRKMAQQEREDREAEGLKANEIETEQLPVNDDNVSEEASAPAEDQPTQQSSSATPSPLTETRPTDRFERNIIRNIVRHGGKSFDYKCYDENDQLVCERWRVIDYIGCVLQQDEIEFNVPLYAKMLQLAYDASEDPNSEWDSVKFFTTHNDPEVSRLALSLESDRYDALGIAKNVEDLDILIPRCVLELQECIVRTEINDCNKALKYPSPDTDVIKIMQRLQELYNIKKVFDKELGERIVTL